MYKEANQDNDMNEINKYLTETTSNNLKSNEVTPGITTIDRYADPMCKTNQYIYCVDGYIECDDIFGNSQNALKNMAPYESGNTLAGCGTYTHKINLNDYIKDYTDISLNLNRDVYFDLSQCDTKYHLGKPWAVGGHQKIEFQGCYPSKEEANDAWDALTATIGISRQEIYNVKDEVLIQAKYLNTLTIQGLPQILDVLDADKTKPLYKIVNGEKYYTARIKKADSALYTVSLEFPGNSNNPIDIDGVSNLYLLKDSLYNKYANDYYSDLKTGSHPRPICKKGTFTSCLANPPFKIKNGEYVSTTDPLLTVYPNNPLQNYPDTGTPSSKGPFVSPLLGPSVDKASNLLEYNYFKNQPSDSPFIQCIADYGTKIGDNLCCGQDGKLEDTKHVCPAEVPTCQGYFKDDSQYGYCV